MFGKGLLLSIISIFIFGICSYAYDYTYTQQSGTNFFVNVSDKSDALEDSNELRQIVNDIGTLLGHSKMDGSYPKDLTTGGTLSITAITLDIDHTNTLAAGLKCLSVDVIQGTNALTGILRGGYITASNYNVEATGTIRGLEVKARTEQPGGSGATVAVLEGISISADSKDQSVGIMRGMEVILDGSTGGTVTEGVGIRIANNMQADKITTMTALQIYSDSFPYDFGIDMSKGVGGIDVDIKLSKGETISNAVDARVTIGGADLNIDNGKVYMINGTQITSSALSDVAYITMLDENETITGNWVNTDNPWADNEIANNITIDLATLATTITVTDNESTNEENPICFVAGADPDGGSLGIETDGTMTYNPSTGVITTTGFAGALTGNVTGNASGSSGSCTGLAATATALATGRDIGGVNFDGTGAIIPIYLSIDHALGTDEDYSGITDSAPVGETVAIGDLLYYDWTDVEWKKAKADAIGTTPAMRIALEAKNNGETCLMLVHGYIRDDDAFNFGAARIFLNDDTAGTCDDTAPAEAGDQIQVVGIGITADILYFCPSIDVGEI